MSMSNELVIYDDSVFMPVMAMESAVARRGAIVSFVQQIMRDGVDFGKIPGTGDKPTLLKPGAEKLITFFGLTPKFVCIEKCEDWTGEQHNGEPFFYYRFSCQLWRGGIHIAEAEGSCNSWEKKYRYRKAERVCPQCGQHAIIKGKKEYGGGWLCFQKKGGCGFKWPDGSGEIEKQDVGQVTNDNPADLVNTVLKMAQKRALVAAVLVGVNASEFFTQDVEDMASNDSYVPPQRTAHVVDGDYEEVHEHKARPWDNPQEEQEITVEQALEFITPKGARLGDCSTDMLETIILSKSPEHAALRKAAKILFDYATQNH